MLLQLSIRNLAVIESVELNFGQGFHVITGETGAGKSMIIDALSLIIGGRGSADFVRHGAARAEIEACFEMPRTHPVFEALENIGVEAVDEMIIIRRELTAQGKSTARINGQLVNLSMLKTIGQWLVNIHGQHEHQSLLQPEQHLKWLDLYAGAELHQIKTQYQQIFSTYQKQKKQLAQLENTNMKSLQMVDLYRLQIEEISNAALKVGEEESLKEEQYKLENAEKLFHTTQQAYENLFSSGHSLELISDVLEQMESIASIDESTFKPIIQQIQTAFYQLEDAAFQIRNYRDQIVFNPDKLSQIEERLNIIYQIHRKYGVSVDDVMQHLTNIKNEVDQIDRKDEIISQLQEEMNESERHLESFATQLSNIRKEAAKRLASLIEIQLKQLHMEKTKFAVQLEFLWDDGQKRLTDQGWDDAQFVISTNPGEPLKPLVKIASGGELSRIMLALKTIFATIDQIPVLIFDEVDTGVSGRAAQAIAEKISGLATKCQIFAITHLPQMACMAEEHLFISKQVNDERTYTQVQLLTKQARVEELARMLGGVEITSTTLHHAEEMLALAKNKKVKV